jgi:flagellar basal body-associated protein FliL
MDISCANANPDADPTPVVLDDGNSNGGETPTEEEPTEVSEGGSSKWVLIIIIIVVVAVLIGLLIAVFWKLGLCKRKRVEPITSSQEQASAKKNAGDGDVTTPVVHLDTNL